MDMFYSGFNELEVSHYITTTMDEQIANASINEQEDLEIIKWTALGMWVSFPRKDLTIFQETKSEKEFKVRLGNMWSVLFVGRSDRLVKKDGLWWVGELKTTGLPLQGFKNRMSVSDQVTAYVYAWKSRGYPVKGVMFDVIKKPLLRKGVNENCEGFCQRIFNDYLNYPLKYHERHYEYRSDEDLNRWEKDTMQVVKKIRRIWGGECFRNTDACWNYNAECCYRKICFMDKPDQLTVDIYFERRVK